MAGPAQNPSGGAVRKRRKHSKSHGGCGNCKMRRVKCDETRPRCNACREYGALCNYDSSTSDLQVMGEGSQTWQITPSNALVRSAPERPLSMGTTFNCTDPFASIILDARSIDRLTRFRSHTMTSLGNSAMAAAPESFKDRFMAHAFSTPCLMYTALALTAMHDRYLSRSSRPMTVVEVSYLSQATLQFQQKLSRPIQPGDRDPIWATAAFLGIATACTIEAADLETTWPVKQSELSDLNWLDIGNNKLTIWHLTDPLRPDGLFNILSAEYAQWTTPITAKGVEGLPQSLVDLCNLSDSSTADSNPYFVAAHNLAHIYEVPPGQINMSKAVIFLHTMHSAYKRLLMEKDPVALLLLACWFSVAAPTAWWIEQRAVIEGPAICLYLERYHQDNKAIQELLPWKAERLTQGVQIAKVTAAS